MKPAEFRKWLDERVRKYRESIRDLEMYISEENEEAENRRLCGEVLRNRRCLDECSNILAKFEGYW